MIRRRGCEHQERLLLDGKLHQKQVEDALAAGSIEVKFARVNARGLLRATEAGRKVLIAKIQPSHMEVAVSPKATKRMLGRSEVTAISYFQCR